MKLVYLVRHAKAIPADLGVEDFKRALADIGEEDAYAVSQQLEKKGISPELWISSPADRALETAHIFAKALRYPTYQILLREELYENTKPLLKKVLAEIEDKFTTVMLFGHNPSFSGLTQEFLPEFKTELPPAGVVGIAFDVSRWQDISPAAATLALFDFPIHIHPKTQKKAKKVLTTKIATTMEYLLEGIDPGISKSVAKVVHKTSKRLAKRLIKVLEPVKVCQLAGNEEVVPIDNLALIASATANLSSSAEQPRFTEETKQKEALYVEPARTEQNVAGGDNALASKPASPVPPLKKRTRRTTRAAQKTDPVQRGPHRGRPERQKPSKTEA